MRFVCVYVFVLACCVAALPARRMAAASRAQRGEYGSAATGKGEHELQTATVCSMGRENQIVRVACPPNMVVQGIVFASFGLPISELGDGTCPFRKDPKCHFNSSEATVARRCINQPLCEFNASVAFFGDPCYGAPKRLAIEALCYKYQSPRAQAVPLNRSSVVNRNRLAADSSGALGSDAPSCPHDCWGHGYCRGHCLCDPGYTGYDCKEPLFCKSDCSGRGSCSQGRCLCNTGFYGSDCSLSHLSAPQLLPLPGCQRGDPGCKCLRGFDGTHNCDNVNHGSDPSANFVDATRKDGDAGSVADGADGGASSGSTDNSSKNSGAA